MTSETVVAAVGMSGIPRTTTNNSPFNTVWARAAPSIKPTEGEAHD